MANEGKDDYQSDPKKIEAFERLSKQIKASQQNDALGILELELPAELQQDGIVESFVFNPHVNSIIVSLNHKYDAKTVICPVDSKHWNKTDKALEKQLADKGINKQHIMQICDTLDSNFNKIFDVIVATKQEQTQESESEEEQEERIENVFMNQYEFRAMKDTKEIYYYDDNKGIYVPNAEVLIESQAESMTEGEVVED